MARYRQKDETDLRWNNIRRLVTRELDTQILKWREGVLNSLLSSAWDKYSKALSAGEKMELESHYESFVHSALSAKTGIELKDV